MAVLCVCAESLVPILALIQFNSAEFSDKEEIIAPLITAWERFSVTKNEWTNKCQNSPDPYNPSVVPLMPSTESLVVSSLRDFTHVITLYMYDCTGALQGNLFWVGVQIRTTALSVALFLWLPLPPVSALCLLHLITFQCLTTVREGSHEEHHSLICLRGRVCVWGVCVCVHMWETMNQSKREGEERWD